MDMDFMANMEAMDAPAPVEVASPSPGVSDPSGGEELDTPRSGIRRGGKKKKKKKSPSPAPAEPAAEVRVPCGLFVASACHSPHTPLCSVVWLLPLRTNEPTLGLA